MDFTGSGANILRDGVINFPLVFSFLPCSGERTNDGSLPYGSIVSTATAVLYSSANVDISTNIIGSVQVERNTDVRILLNYSAIPAKGRCKLLLSLNLNTGSVLVKRYDRLTIE